MQNQLGDYFFLPNGEEEMAILPRKWGSSAGYLLMCSRAEFKPDNLNALSKQVD